MNKRVVSLSTKSLIRVWEWVEQHEDTPLADFYVSLCKCVAEIDEVDHAKVTVQAAGYRVPEDKHRMKRWWRVWEATWDARQMTFDARDTVGRIILDMLNREGK